MQRSGIGFLGGTFDPIHCGHLRLACALRDELMLSKVYLVPAGNPYHKTKYPIATPQQRLEMVKLAIQSEPLLEVDDRDIIQLTSTYTVPTLQAIRQELGIREVLWYLMGMDAFAKLSTWKDWRTLLQLTNLAVARRNLCDLSLPSELIGLWQRRRLNLVRTQASGQLYVLNLPAKAVASKDLRQSFVSGQKIDHTLVPKAVGEYIVKNAIYAYR